METPGNTSERREGRRGEGREGQERTRMFLLTPSDPAHSRAANTTTRTTVSPLRRPCRTSLGEQQHDPRPIWGNRGWRWRRLGGGGDLGAWAPPEPRTWSTTSGLPLSRLVAGALPGPVPLSRWWGSAGGAGPGSRSPSPRDESPRESVGREGRAPTAPFHMKTVGPRPAGSRLLVYLGVWTTRPHPVPSQRSEVNSPPSRPSR